jgi:uncharacterized protein YbjT (DUF2867 family)
MSSILVTGGTGCLGSAVVSRLLDAGHDVRVASRRQRPSDVSLPYSWATVDYRSGVGLAPAVAGVDAIVHCAGSMRVPVDRNLVAAARRGGPHLVYISIVGVDRVPMAYYRSKLAAERLIEKSGLPHTILRATQFHDLIRLMLAALARIPVMPVPDMRIQPVDVGDVAARLADLAVGAPAGRVADMGGPEIHALPGLARSYLRVTGRNRPVVPFRLPGKVFAGYRAGGHLAPGHATGARTFEDYLAAQSNPAALSYRPKPS